MVLRSLLLLLFSSAAFAAEELSVTAKRSGDGVEVRAHALIEAAWETVWGTLTDYNRLGEFIPGMRSSRIVSQQGPAATVEQVGEAKVLFFSFPIEVTVVSTARPPNAIDVRVLKGSFRRLDGGYRVHDAGNGRIALGWEGVIEPDFPLPPLLGEVLLRANIEDQFTGMVKEIERREALRSEGRKGNAAK